MYGKFSVGFRVISERATKELQYKDASLEGVYVPMHPIPISTLPGMTQMTIPLAKSIPITQSSQVPAMSNTVLPIRDIMDPASNEQARSTYLEKQMRQMGSINKLPSDMPSLEDGIVKGLRVCKTGYNIFVERIKTKGSRSGNIIGWF